MTSRSTIGAGERVTVALGIFPSGRPYLESGVVDSVEGGIVHGRLHEVNGDPLSADEPRFWERPFTSTVSALLDCDKYYSWDDQDVDWPAVVQATSLGETNHLQHPHTRPGVGGIQGIIAELVEMKKRMYQ